MPSCSTMTKHELARRVARVAGCAGIKRDGLKRRRKNWLAKQHRAIIAGIEAEKARAKRNATPC